MIIEWSPLARLDFTNNIEYLLEEWSEKEVFSFIENVDYNLELLTKSNISFLNTGYKNVFKVVIIKQISLFYTINNNTIILLRFWNNFQDLNKFKLR